MVEGLYAPHMPNLPWSFAANCDVFPALKVIKRVMEMKEFHG
jgi:hypothetical protein